MLELSSEYITRKSRQSSSFPILNQPDSRTQQVSFVSARFLRIGKILRIGRLPYTTDSRHGFTSIESQPSTVRHNFGPSVVCSSCRQRTLRTFAGSWAVIHGLRALLSSSSSLDVLCPFVGLLVYGHRPFRFMPTGFVTVLCLRALFIYAYGPSSFYISGPLPDLLID